MEDSGVENECDFATCLDEVDDFVSDEFHNVMSCWVDTVCNMEEGSGEGDHEPLLFDFAPLDKMKIIHNYQALMSFDSNGSDENGC